MRGQQYEQLLQRLVPDLVDHECDGHEVHTTVVFRNGTHAFVFDPSGCGSGVGRKFFDRYIVKYKVCAEGVGCSNWNLP